jgi:hypothetical protein
MLIEVDYDTYDEEDKIKSFMTLIARGMELDIEFHDYQVFVASCYRDVKEEPGLAGITKRDFETPFEDL